MADSYLTYKGKRWLWISVVSAVAVLTSYLLYQQKMDPHGGTVMGLIYGAGGSTLIIILMVIGIRKRRYASSMGTLQGWVSAHVYLGLLTLLLVTLHAGFKFGIDFHSLAYILLCIVVISGIAGVIFYQNVPARLTQDESKIQADKIDAAISQLLADMRRLAKDKSDDFVKIYRDEVARTNALKPRVWSLLLTGLRQDRLTKRAEQLAALASHIAANEQTDFENLCQLLLQKTQLESTLMAQMRLRNALEAWLYFHLPFSIAMTIAVIVHIVSVFYY